MAVTTQIARHLWPFCPACSEQVKNVELEHVSAPNGSTYVLSVTCCGRPHLAHISYRGAAATQDEGVRKLVKELLDEFEARGDKVSLKRSDKW